MPREDLPPLSQALICRCEGVTCGDVLEAASRLRPTSLRELKLVTRVGMGICQGRVCRPALEGLGRELGLAPGPREVPARTPLRPVRMGLFADPQGREGE